MKEINFYDKELCLNITVTPRGYDRFRSTDSIVYDPHVYEQITFCCPICSNLITFKDKDFQKHSGSNFSNLDG
jgi:hypothetical protein